MKVMSIRLPEELYAKLEVQAEAVGVAPAVLARVYLKDLIEKRHHGAGIVEGMVDGEPDFELEEAERRLNAQKRRVADLIEKRHYASGIAEGIVDGESDE